MSITDELREYALGWDEGNRVRRDLTAIADRIDAEHEHEDAMAEHGWVKLPVSEDGDVLHVGELVDEKLPFGGYAAPAPIDTMELSRGASGYVWMVKLDAENRALVSPKLLRHRHEPTVEDVLREMLEQAVGYSDAHTTVALNAIAKYSAKLRLAGEDE